MTTKVKAAKMKGEGKKAAARCVSCKGTATRDWHAWHNCMPPPPDDFHIVGEINVPNPGVDPILVPRQPQGFNPKILMMDIILCQKPGFWPQMFVWKTVQYDKILLKPLYDKVQIYCDVLNVADLPVQLVQ